MSGSSRRLRILVTNNTLGARTGSELYVRDLALGLLRRGHTPVAYSSVLGAVADELTAASIPVLDDLRSLSVAPDVIHAHHHLDAMCAMLRFPAVPTVFVCHGWQPWQEQPPVFPAIRRYVGVDDVCTERILTTPGVDPARVRTVYNAVDLMRFGRRPQPLPDRPRSALIFSNYASEDNYVGIIREACRAASIERVDVIGLGSGAAVDRPELVLPQYDLVFAKARCALEAMAVGAAVIVADFSGLGGMVAPENAEAMRRLNFGLRTMQRWPLTGEAVAREIARYDAESSAAVCAFIRSNCDAVATIDQFERLYEEALAEPVVWSADAGRHACDAASSYMVTLADMLKGQSDERRRHADTEARSAAGLQAARHEREALRAELASSAVTSKELLARTEALAVAAAERSTLRSDLARQDRDLAARTRALANTEAMLDRTQADLTLSQHSLAAANRELDALRGSRTWRVLGAYRGVRNWLREV
jgi:Glycosyltransferase Family 4